MKNGNKKTKRESKKAFKKIQYDGASKVKIVSNDKTEKGRSKDPDGPKPLLILSLDPYEKPLQWWESNYIKYAITYKPVKLRVESLMASNVVRLTDRKYMMLLMDNIRNHHKNNQMIRIEEKKEWAKLMFGSHTFSDISKCS
ncbi:hypothetical protein KPH14_012160 [Odynerus spinipes]|uniref:Uncharacterized protein n=1 Tax=Odynerus spinipes TaxID=1348599 RepID=A0AAD9VM15_9HYME|nr:hypothetical protein KPH14_012160 [Odynerus spinipes]